MNYSAKFRILSFSLTILLLISSCQDTDYSIPAGHRKSVDSLVRGAVTTDSLQNLYCKFVDKDDKLGCIVALKEIGKRKRNESNFDEALALHTKVLDLAEQINDTLEIVQALNNIGTDYRRIGVLESATTYHYRAWKLSDIFSDTSYAAKKNRVVSLNGLGNIYMSTKNYDRAEEVLRKALEGEIELGSYVGQAINYANIGSIYVHRGQLDSAWVYYRNSMKFNEKARNSLGIALGHTYFGRMYEREYNYIKAIEEYTISLNMMKASKDEWHTLNALIALIDIHIKIGMEDEALRELSAANEIAERIKSKSHRADICKYYYLISRKRGNWLEALEYHERATALEDSVVDIKKLNQIQNLSIAIERSQQERLTNEALRQYETERTYRIASYLIMGSIFILLVSFIGILFYSLRIRQRNINLFRALSNMRETFFVNITHELRTPLTIIMGLSHDLSKNADNPDKTREIGGVIERHGANLLSLINQLLDIAKIKSAHGEPDWRHGDIAAYVSMIVDTYREYAYDKGIDLQYVTKGKLDMDFVPDYINKVLNNLLSNAFKFTPRGGKITVRVVGSDGDAVIVVSDTGSGIPKESIGSIFDPFVQADSNSKHIGTGVGLALVKQIVQSVDGSIGVVSKVGAGSDFTVRMPLQHGSGNWKQLESDLTQSGADANLAELSALDGAADLVDSELSDERERLLIIEDNNDVARYIGSHFDSKYDIVYATNGKIGLDKARDILPDVIITDLMMPEMDGLEVCRSVRADEIISHIPIIIVTAKVSDEDRIKGLEAGADAYLGKPFNSDELKIRVEKLLERKQNLRDNYLKAMAEGNETEVQRTEVDRRFLCKTVDTIYLLMERKQLDVNALADKLCMSPRQFHRKIIALTGDTPAAYVLQIKMRRAKQLIESKPKLSIDDIAEVCGFEHYSSFYQSFKKIYGVTPSQYKRGVK